MARSFNGSSDFIDVGAHAALALPTTGWTYTLSAWVFGAAIAPGPVFVIANDDNTLGRQFAFGLTSGPAGSNKFYFETTGTGIITTPNVPVSEWAHIAVTVNSNSAGGAISYVNGASGATGTSSTPQTFTGHTTIGERTFSGFNDFFSGNIADVAYWNVVLSAGNISSLYNGVRPINVNSANLVGWWPLDGYASPETDLSGNGFSGTLTGTARVVGPPQLWRLSA